ncbi:SHOCT domain-containing protein [Actinocrinis puniceicyclus]|uniref:SHOCT domain-containing protein n=1 Tax=Actinocrinis puniceicyclus TaxID=977794 RepID=A0A8J7WPN6_9ACTN|nr:SHOCT domain-containing protein [Actinocrinis puniceicyclus]MBS2963244.1 SHOCT domain-containing protein [Actinocrinis puniceicyclus]
MMYWYGDHGMSGWAWGLATIGMIVFWGVLIAAGVALFRYLAHGPRQQNHAAPGAGITAHSAPPAPPASPEAILAERFARGEIDEEEYHARLATLRGTVRT